METIKLNRKAGNEAYEKALNDAIEYAKKCAEKGIEYPTINFWAPTYIIGSKVKEALKNVGVVCQESGFGSDKNIDGSYDFRIKCRIVE